MIGSKLLDASIVLEYLHNKKFVEFIESEEHNFVSILTIFEIKKILLKNGKSRDEVDTLLRFLKERVVLVEVDIQTVELAADESYSKNLPAFDSIIYATALLNKIELLTTDNDFRGLPSVKVFEKY